MWLNALTPAAAAFLAQILSLSVADRWEERLPSPASLGGQIPWGPVTRNAELTAERAPLPELLLGFDGRAFSAEVFAGAVTAVRELGANVLDVGRSTAALLQEVLRCHPRLAGALFITGAGAPAGWSGLDATDVAGDGVQVVWREFGVGLRSMAVAGQSDGLPEPQSGLRLSLQLPEAVRGGRALRRLSRTAGRYAALDFEERYREWLKGWHGGLSSARLLVGTDDGLVRQRVQWLAEHCGWSLAVCSAAEARRAESGASIEVLEDDRWFVLRRAGGERVAAERLAQWLNSATAAGSRTSQLTAHADAVTGRLWFSDAARPGNAGMTERIEDALAVAGVLLGSAGLLSDLQPVNLPGNRSSPPRAVC